MKKSYLWGIWGVLTLALITFFSTKLLVSDDKEIFLIGDASHGHFQIEMSCDTCHSSAFSNEDVLQEACTQCHLDDLKQAHDSHPKTKFTDPRNADRLEILDARYCITCHTEHQQEYTHKMGVTLPDDYCYHCHEDIAEDRPSHKNLAFDSCASAGCHNYHDNRALYETFLVENAHQQNLLSQQKEKPTLPRSTDLLERKPPLNLATSNFQDPIAQHPKASHAWEGSEHAAAGVDCGACHQPTSESEWIEKPGAKECESCHQREVEAFTQSRHGMRLAGTPIINSDAVSPKESSLNFRESAHERQHGCNACHSAHLFSTRYAGTDACLACHNDSHSRNFKLSPHANISPDSNYTSISCSTCHMPEIEHEEFDQKVRVVQHNPNWNLRPNEKMIRSVCMDCHGLQFSLNALADEKLIERNFKGLPDSSVPSINWSLKNQKKNFDNP